MLNDIKDKCVGCFACKDVCPQKIISTREDNLGFKYPIVFDKESCIDCNLCNQVCPAQKNKETVLNVGSVKCARTKNVHYLEKCSSGGIFAELCNNILQDGGVCIGAAFSHDYGVEHCVVTCKDDLYKILGSKYSQSNLDGIFNVTKKLVCSGKKVLFSGTPCQIEALNSFLRKEYDNLFLIDLFCYGVPSPLVWKEWLSFITKQRKIKSINFRDKSDSWENYSLNIIFDDNSKYVKTKKEDLFLMTFSKGCYIRDCCYSCKFKGFNKVSDLTLGDFQELHALFPNLDSKLGYSMVRINSHKGEKLFDEIMDKLDYHDVTAETMNNCHPNMGLPSRMHPNRLKFIKKMKKKHDISRLLHRYARFTSYTNMQIWLNYKKEAFKRILHISK